MLVEPSCGASLATVYSNLFKQWKEEGRIAEHLSSVVVVVCGGNMITFDQLLRWKKEFGEES